MPCLKSFIGSLSHRARISTASLLPSLLYQHWPAPNAYPTYVHSSPQSVLQFSLPSAAWHSSKVKFWHLLSRTFPGESQAALVLLLGDAVWPHVHPIVSTTWAWRGWCEGSAPLSPINKKEPVKICDCLVFLTPGPAVPIMEQGFSHFCLFAFCFEWTKLYYNLKRLENSFIKSGHPDPNGLVESTEHTCGISIYKYWS